MKPPWREMGCVILRDGNAEPASLPAVSGATAETAAVRPLPACVVPTRHKTQRRSGCKTRYSYLLLKRSQLVASSSCLQRSTKPRNTSLSEQSPGIARSSGFLFCGCHCEALEHSAPPLTRPCQNRAYEHSWNTTRKVAASELGRHGHG
jgi:hypothetical protein